jgi:hypothetical protein
MINIKYIFVRLWLLTYSPSFPTILGLIIFISYRVYFEPIALCDDNGYSLFQLKVEITSETGNYRAAVVKCEQYQDLKEQVDTYRQSEPDYDSYDAETKISKKLKDYQADKIKCLAKVRELETTIRKIEPDFQSPVGNFNYYPRIGKGY